MATLEFRIICPITGVALYLDFSEKLKNKNCRKYKCSFQTVFYLLKQLISRILAN